MDRRSKTDMVSSVLVVALEKLFWLIAMPMKSSSVLFLKDMSFTHVRGPLLCESCTSRTTH